MADSSSVSARVAAARAAESLNAFFSDKNGDQGANWSALWDSSEWLPFDRGKPGPALCDALADRKDLLGDAVRAPDDGAESRPAGERRKAFVPGCGRGYDVYLLKSFGWDVVGLEISATAVEKAREEGRKIEAGDRQGLGYDVKDEAIGSGEASFELGDFFQHRVGETGVYDLIYDYTFLSALPPSLRPAWAATFARLLSPTGRLICVEFPTTKRPDSGGPPWALPEEVYLGHLGQPGEHLPYGDDHRVIIEKDSLVAPGGLERIAHWRPVRSHEFSRGTDWVSVWQHSKASS